MPNNKQYTGTPKPVGTQPSRGQVGSKNPEVGVRLLKELAPDSPQGVKWPAIPSTNSLDSAKGSVPGGTQAVQAPHYVDNRTPPQPGADPGPM
jgi:hypothetical protein